MDATTRGTLTNTATVESSQADVNPGDDTATVTTTVRGVADLSVVKSDSPDPVVAGETLMYVLTVHNDGPSATTDVTLTDFLPAAVSFSTSTPSCTYASGTLTCSLGDLPVGATTMIAIHVTVDSRVTGAITNSAEVASAETDPDSGNNTPSATTTVVPQADLSVTKSGSPDPVIAGSTLVYSPSP